MSSKFRPLLSLLLLFCFALPALPALPALAAVEAVDDGGHRVRLEAPARRIVSLAPDITELLYAAGAGRYLVGAVDYSDYPPAARSLPRVGGYRRLDVEALLALHPDLVVAWSGNAAASVERIRALGLPLFLSDPHHLEDIPSLIERLGRLAGSAPPARRAAAGFRARVARLRGRYAGRSTVGVFYEVWNSPLMTVGGGQILNDVLRLCGGRNVFGGLSEAAPQISVEALLVADPEVIVVSGMGELRPQWLADWRRWPQLTAVRRNNLFLVPPDLLQRAGPRLLDGAALLCRDLELARSRR